MLPLYQAEKTREQAKSVFTDKRFESHSGLWFERFYDYLIFKENGNYLDSDDIERLILDEDKDRLRSEFQKDEREPLDRKKGKLRDYAHKKSKKNFFDIFNTPQGTRKCGNEKALERYTQRQHQLCAAQGGKSRIYQNDWLMAIGLGNSHPLENGLLWHPTLGVPYFQGSTVKGLAKALMEKWGADPQLIKRWFGSVNAAGSKTADFAAMFGQPLTEELRKQLDEQSIGAFIFLDAVPVQPVMLKQAVMTPHYGNWYLEGGDKPIQASVQPGDWHSPVPINFLTVEKAVMQFCVMPRLGAQVTDDELEQMSNVIAMALEHLGIGAKTATGFGRMLKDQNAEKQQQELHKKALEEAEHMRKEAEFDQLLSQVSELERELLMEIRSNKWDEKNDESKRSFTQEVEKWLEKLQNHPDNQSAINKFIEITSLHYEKQIKNPSKAKDSQKKWLIPLLALKKQ